MILFFNIDIYVVLGQIFSQRIEFFVHFYDNVQLTAPPVEHGQFQRGDKVVPFTKAKVDFCDNTLVFFCYLFPFWFLGHMKHQIM